MKKIISGIIVFAFITFSTQAQVKRNTPERPQQSSMDDAKKHHKINHKQMAEKLHLTDAQKQQVKSVNMDFKSRMQQLKSDNKLSAAELETKKAALKKERMQNTKALLTPEQKKQMKELKKENHAKKEKVSAKKIEKMQNSLGLSNGQVEKIKTEKNNFKIQQEAINHDQSLTMDQRKEKIGQLKDDRRTEFKSYLTPEQIKKLEEMKHKDL